MFYTLIFVIPFIACVLSLPVLAIEAHFGPDEDLAALLVDALDRETSFIGMAIPYPEHPVILSALKRAAERGVRAELITDPSALQLDAFSDLEEAGVAVYLFDPQRYGAGRALALPAPLEKLDWLSKGQPSRAYFHNKFCLFGKNSGGRPLVWSGSFNFTLLAAYQNQDNIVIVDELAVYRRFASQFRLMREKRSVVLSVQPF